MILSVLALMLANAAPAAPVVEELPDGQFRVTVTERGMDADRLMNAQLRLMAAAAQRCAGRGRPQEIGRGEIVINARGGIAMISVYRCEAPARDPAPAPPGNSANPA
jgi:hypothetical protein